MEKPQTTVSDLNRDLFLRSLIRELAGVLEEIVGYEEASGYISLVGQNIGDWLNDIYRKDRGVEQLSPSDVSEVLVNLKKRIQGDFYLIEHDDRKIVLGSRSCPFGSKVIDRPSMCMMTSNVFGVIASQNLGYAKVELRKTIARGDDQCEVIVYTAASPESDKAEGREYFREAGGE